MADFTHFDEQGNAWMVDVFDKAETERCAVARGSIFMNEECFEKVKEGTTAKGDVLTVAQVAGIMGAKKTSELIPLCHPLPLTKLSIQFELKQEKVNSKQMEAEMDRMDRKEMLAEQQETFEELREVGNRKNEIVVECTAKTHGVTGVEMEALTGVQIALLTIYDMCKAIDKAMHIENVHLVSKTGGKSGDFVYEGSV